MDIYPSQAAEARASELKEELMAAKQALESAGYVVSRRVQFGKVAAEIEAFIAQEGIALIAMTMYGRTDLSRMGDGSIVPHLFHQGTIPILLVRAQLLPPAASA
jgi:nucleotide-binding universal stress UspA family protein